jgi:hypothetical protein
VFSSEAVAFSFPIHRHFRATRIGGIPLALHFTAARWQDGAGRADPNDDLPAAPADPRMTMRLRAHTEGIAP